MRKNIKFEAFEETGLWFGKKPYIKILAGGGFSFTTGFMKKFFKKNPNFVALRHGSDEDNIYIGFSFSDDSATPGALKIGYPKKVTNRSSSYGIMRNISFFKKYKIDNNKYKGPYKAEEHEDANLGKLYFITLRKEE